MYSPSGHLLYVRDRVLMARPFNAASLSVRGEAFEVPLFNGRYAPSADGRRFLLALPVASTDVVPMELRLNPLAPR